MFSVDRKLVIVPGLLAVFQRERPLTRYSGECSLRSSGVWSIVRQIELDAKGRRVGWDGKG